MWPRSSGDSTSGGLNKIKSPHAVDEQESARRIAFVPQLMIKSNAARHRSRQASRAAPAPRRWEQTSRKTSAGSNWRTCIFN